MAATTYRFGVLGPFVVEQDGRALTPPTGRQRSLLALLLLAGGVPRSRDRLIDELWGEQPPASAVSALHVHLSKLRVVLGDLLVSDAAGYALVPDRFELDARLLDALLERARRDASRARSLLSEALALFRGDPLCDVACEGSVAQWRRGLEDKRLEAIVLRVDADLAVGAAAELVVELERLCAENPYEERLWGQLMLALYRSGRQADALEAFQRLRRHFAQELGLELGEPLQRLQRQMLERDPVLLRQTDAERPTVARPTSNVPRPPGSLLGREQELVELAAMAADPDARIITLAGVGGVGKTRLLLELARREEPNHRDGAVFVRLEQLRDPSLVAAEVATAISQRDGSEDLDADALARYLRGRDLLLVLDNFEHLLAATVLVTDLVAQAPLLRVLISSRTPLQVRGEQVFEVEPLELPDGDSQADIARSPAVQLFLQCAVAANRRLQIDSAFTHTVGTICTALDGLPLAIELAASRSRSLSVDQIAQQLERPLSVGQRGLRDLPERQQTLQATIEWSYELLTPTARTVLSNAGALVGGFTLASLEAVVGRPSQLELDELIEASLVRRQPRTDRYSLLELVRAFAAEKLEASGLAPEARARHRRYFSALVAPAAAQFNRHPAPIELAALLGPDHANCRAALEDAIDHGDVDAAVQLALGLRPLWHADMLRQEAHELIGRLLDRLRVPADKEIALLRAASYLDHVDSSSVGQVGFTRRLAARAEALGDRTALAIATGNLFGDAINARDLDEMRRLKLTLLDLVAGEQDDEGLGWIHYNLALEAYVEGHLDQACDHASRSAETCGGDELTLAVALATRLLAESARDETIPQPALAETIEVMRRPGIKTLTAFALWFIARYAAGVAPEVAERWLAYGEQIRADLDVRMWPESVLRDETMAALGITDLTSLLESTPQRDHVAALGEAAAWLAGRDPAETAPRVSVQRPLFA